MADKEVRIEVTAKTEMDEVETLEEVIDNIKDKVEDPLELETNAEEVADEFDSLGDSAESAASSVDDVSESTSNIDSSKVSETGEEFDKLSESAKNAADNVEKSNESVEETDNTVSNLKTTLLGLVATAEIEHMATVADNINTSWNRLSLTFEGTGVTMDTLKEKVSEVSAETSRSGGTIRDYFNQMGIAGVTNANLLAESFESLSGKAYQTDSSIESMESKMQTMVLTGNASSKMLKSLGLSAQDLAIAMGVSVDDLSDAFSKLSPEQRLQAITIAMGDGASANEMYGNSYEAMKAKADAAMSGLEGAIGQAILPSVIPALDAGTQAVKSLTEGFKNLPEPVQGAIGTVMGVGAIATTGIGMFGEFAGAIANLGDAYGVLKDVYTALIPVEYAEGTAGWFSIGWIAVAILAGIALGLALIYLYNNSEQFRNAVNWLGEKLKWLAGVIVTNVTNAVNQFRNIIQAIPQSIKACLDWAYNLIMSHPIVQAAVWLGQAIANGFSALGLGQRSPGKIVKAMRQELDWTEEAILKSNLADTTATLGSDVARNFNPNLNTMNNTVNGSYGQVNNFYFTDTVVDNEDRMQRIVEYVAKSISWDNTTAGRTV